MTGRGRGVLGADTYSLSWSLVVVTRTYLSVKMNPSVDINLCTYDLYFSGKRLRMLGSSKYAFTLTRVGNGTSHKSEQNEEKEATMEMCVCLLGA